MLRRKIRESLTARIFLITVLILFSAGAVTFGLIALATPITYTTVVGDDLTRQVAALAETLSRTPFEESGSVLDEFIRASGADASLTDSAGNAADTWYTTEIGDSIAVTSSSQGVIAMDVQFADRDEIYTLCVTSRMQAENLAVRALIQMAPWLLLALLVFSPLCAFVYSRYITRPILRLSDIAGRMAELDFDWECQEQRRDEIGKLGRSLNTLSHRLSAALTDLKSANHALQKEMERERELDRQRMAFFSAASHELKTPVTILKGQLSGMLEGVDVYKDRDKYLFRSLQVTGRMEKLIQEMLAISRMETASSPVQMKELELSELLQSQLALYTELISQRGQRLVSSLTPGIVVRGDTALLGKAIGNLLSNAAHYSPDGAEIRVWCGVLEERPALTVENTGTYIGEEALSHLFEPFYREESSRNRSTGGSGLGLYLLQMILKRHNASCAIENTDEGVRATIRFPASST